MTNFRDNPKPLESLLGEFAVAQRAGVFRTTAIDVDAILRPSAEPALTWTGWLRKPRVALSLAATVALAATTWTWMIRMELRSISNRRDQLALINDAANDLSGSPSAPLASRFSSGCMTGPAQETDEPCNDSDLVADGHIDLRDFGLLQRAPQPR